MPIDARILLGGQVADVTNPILRGIEAGRQIRQAPMLDQQMQLANDSQAQVNTQNAELFPIRKQVLESQAGQLQNQNAQDIEKQRILNNAKNSLTAFHHVQNEDYGSVVELGLQEIESDPETAQESQQVVELARRAQAGDAQAAETLNTVFSRQAQQAQEILNLGGATTRSAGQREFESLIKDFTPEQQKRAREVKARIAAPEVGASDKIVDIGGVPHVFDPETNTMSPVQVKGSEVTSDVVGESEANIAGKKETAVKQAGISASAVKSSFEQLPKINVAIKNIDNAIQAIDEGAETGVIDKMLPSIKQASIKLDNVRSKMGLDVVGSVTFGALSASELSLALDTALPIGMQPEELREWLVDKKDAQQKLAAGLEEAAIYLSEPGNTVAGLVKLRRSQQADKRNQSQSTNNDEIQELLKLYGPK